MLSLVNNFTINISIESFNLEIDQEDVLSLKLICPSLSQEQFERVKGQNISFNILRLFKSVPKMKLFTLIFIIYGMLLISFVF